MEDVFVSILICSKGRFDSLRRLVDQLRTIETDDFGAEIVVIEETETPDPIPGTVYHHLPVKELGFGYARQRAIEAAHGSLFVFIDDDCTPLPGWITHLLSLFGDREVSAVGGGILPQASNSIGKAIALLGFPAGGMPRLLKSGGRLWESRLLSAGNLALRREAVEAVGGFSALHKYDGEEQELVRVLPGRTFFQPRALVAHKQRESIREVWRWFVRRGKGRYFVNRSLNMGRVHAVLHPWRWSWWWRTPVFIVLAVLFGLIPVLSLLISYFLFLLFRTFLANRRPSSIPEVEICRRHVLTAASLVWAPIVRLTMDVGREWGRLRALFEDMKNE